MTATASEANAPEILQTIPMLRMFDVDKTKSFYIGFLGFSLDWEHRFEAGAPLYMQVSRSGLNLHLSEHHGDCTPGSAVFVVLRGLDAYHRELTSKTYAYMNPGIEDKPWGARGMSVIDPNGNTLHFNEYTGNDNA